MKLVKYIIRPSKRQELLDDVMTKYTGEKRSRMKSLIVYNKPKSFARWANWFDLDVLNNVLMEEDCEEIVVNQENNFNIEADLNADNVFENIENLGI